MRLIRNLLVAGAVTTLGAPNLWAKKKAEPGVVLSEAGQKLEEKYASYLETLRKEIIGALPKLDAGDQSAYLKAREAEVVATKELDAAKARMGEVGKAQGLVGHAKGKWIGGADKGIAAAKEKLKKAKTADEREAAKKDLAHWEQNREEGVAALKERQALLDKALKERPKVEKAAKEAEKAVADAKAATVKAIKDLGLQDLLSSDKLDAKLAGFVVLTEASPKGLAGFAQQGEAQQELVELMFADGDLLVQMAVADGAAGGKYGRAMEIYRDIRKASDKAGEGTLQRLALAVALEHAEPVAQRNAVDAKDAPSHVDPVERYLHFEKAFLNDELDPAFKDLTVWDYRMVVDGEEPNDVLAWGREMLRNYRPDQVTKPDYRWRYVEIVRSDIRYGSEDNKYDRDDLQFFQNILKNGGICGRRAFFGRFTLRAFGIPTTARPQKGHAALVHWTPEGWVPCLGAGWGSGWTKTRYNKDLDFLANTQARATGEPFMKVKRAQWIGDVMGEPRVFGFLSGDPKFWYGVSLYVQQSIIEAAKSKTLDAVGQDIAEANVTKEVIEITDVELTDADRQPTVDSDGVITIPAAATSNPTKSTGKIIFMDSTLGGKQLHYSRNGGSQPFEYTFDAPAAGKYEITARIVTPSWQQSLLVTVNDSKEQAEIELPHTVGLWGETAPVVIELKKGKNVLRFSRQSAGNEKGFSVKDFTLTPVGN
ncbi:hypothetical protein [Haloferula helveola]